MVWFTFTLEMLILRESWGQERRERERGEEERETRGTVAWWIVDSGRGLSQALARQCSDGNSAGNCRNLSALRRVGPVGMVRRNHRSMRENRKCNWRSGFESNQAEKKLQYVSMRATMSCTDQGLPPWSKISIVIPTGDQDNCTQSQKWNTSTAFYY